MVRRCCDKRSERLFGVSHRRMQRCVHAPCILPSHENVTPDAYMSPRSDQLCLYSKRKELDGCAERKRITCCVRSVLFVVSKRKKGCGILGFGVNAANDDKCDERTVASCYYKFHKVNKKIKRMNFCW